MRVMVTVDMRDPHAVLSALEAGGITVDRSVPAVPLGNGEGVIFCEIEPEQEGWLRDCPGVIGVFSDPEIGPYESDDDIGRGDNHICCGGCGPECDDEDD